MKKTILTISILFLSISFQAQNQVFVNKGDFSTRSGTELSTQYDFVNSTSGNVINDGSIHFYGDYTNEGLFSYSSLVNSSKVVFEGENKSTQTLGGSSPSFFYDALFNKPSNHAFDVFNPIETGGTVNFMQGVLFIPESEGGSFTFLKGSTHINTSDISHVDGQVQKEGDESFQYPIGNSGYYRYAGISAPKNIASSFSGDYLLANSDITYPHKNKVGVIKQINNKEYWIVNKTTELAGSVILTLSWDERTTPSELINQEDEVLHIVRWDQEQQLWLDQGGIVDYANQTVTTPVDLTGFGVFTLATVKKELLLPGDLVIYNGVTPDGDGLNDYFIIENIQYYPNNSVRIFNRWGVEVFKTTNYDSNGNVFNGYSDARATLDKSSKLPTGTYYYILEYEYTNEGATQTIKKAGYLHLESND